MLIEKTDYVLTVYSHEENYFSLKAAAHGRHGQVRDTKEGFVALFKEREFFAFARDQELDADGPIAERECDHPASRQCERCKALFLTFPDSKAIQTKGLNAFVFHLTRRVEQLAYEAKLDAVDLSMLDPTVPGVKAVLQRAILDAQKCCPISGAELEILALYRRIKVFGLLPEEEVGDLLRLVASSIQDAKVDHHDFCCKGASQK